MKAAQSSYVAHRKEEKQDIRDGKNKTFKNKGNRRRNQKEKRRSRTQGQRNLFLITQLTDFLKHPRCDLCHHRCDRHQVGFSLIPSSIHSNGRPSATGVKPRRLISRKLLLLLLLLLFTDKCSHEKKRKLRKMKSYIRFIERKSSWLYDSISVLHQYPCSVLWNPAFMAKAWTEEFFSVRSFNPWWGIDLKVSVDNKFFNFNFIIMK